MSRRLAGTGGGPWFLINPGQGGLEETTSPCSIKDTPERERALHPVTAAREPWQRQA